MLRTPLTMYFVLKPIWLGSGKNVFGQHFFGYGMDGAHPAGHEVGGVCRFYNGVPGFEILW